MQFCWLQSELRPSSEEVHLLVTYLCAKGSSEAEEDFEQRWNSLRPNLLGSTSHTASSTGLVLTPTPNSADVLSAEQTQAVELASSASSSFPLLEHFSDSFHSDTGDDLLTVTETSHGLNFEYKWEQARAEQPYCSSSTSGTLGQENPHYQDIYYSNTGSFSGGCKTDSLTSSMSPSYYEHEHRGIVPVLSAHSPSVSSEYYIRIEEPVQCNIKLEDGVVDYSSALEGTHIRSFSENHRGSSKAQPCAYWSTADNTTSNDSDSSPTIQQTLQPLLHRSSSNSPVKSGHSFNYLSSDCNKIVHCEHTAVCKTHKKSSSSNFEASPESQTTLLHPEIHLENQRSLSQAVSSPSLGFCDPYLETRTFNESLHSQEGLLKKTLPVVNHIDINMGTDDGLLLGQRRSEAEEVDLFSEGEATNWISNHSANNNSLSLDSRQMSSGKQSCLNVPSSTTELWYLTKATTRTFQSFKSCGNLEGSGGCSDCEPVRLGPYIHLCDKERGPAVQVEMQTNFNNLQNTHSLSSSNSNTSETRGRQTEVKYETQSLPHREGMYSETPKVSYTKSSCSLNEYQSGSMGTLSDRQKNISEGVPAGPGLSSTDVRLKYTETSANNRTLDSGVGVRGTSSCLVELGDYSEDDDDDDITDITSGIFADFNLDLSEVEEEELSPRSHPERVPDSVDVINLVSSVRSSCDQGFSPDPFIIPILPKSLDSGYDTENNESPEFIFKELGDPLGGENGPMLRGESEIALQVSLGQGVCTSTSTSELHVKGLFDRKPYRDSAYFSDYDAENDRSPSEENQKLFAGSGNSQRLANGFNSVEDSSVERQFTNGESLTNLRHIKSYVLVNLSEADSNSPCTFSTPGLSMLSPFPPQMGGCLTKEAAPAEDDLGLETEHSADEPPSELSSSAGSEPCSSVHQPNANQEEGSKEAEGCYSVHSLLSGCTINDCRDESCEETENGDGSTDEKEVVPENNLLNNMTEDRTECVRINEEDFEDIDADESDSLCEESNGHHELSTSSSLLELCGEDVRAPLEEAEDEDDSDDSESDEELRTYNVQDEDSEDSEEDLTTVPVVVSDCSRARHLRGLLKMPTLLTQSFCDELETKKKAVSFFDDVTVFLFDQVQWVRVVEKIVLIFQKQNQ